MSAKGEQEPPTDSRTGQSHYPWDTTPFQSTINPHKTYDTRSQTMKSQRFLISAAILAVLLALMVGLGALPSARAGGQAQAPQPQQITGPQAEVGNAFTYQGYLKDGSNPANGKYDFQFILYNALSGGSQAGSIVATDDVAVTKGLFTVALDFGTVFDGTGLWLEVAVRPGSSTGSYAILSPRQEITPAPYALSLKPGATIQGDSSSANLGTDYVGVYGEGRYGVRGYSDSPGGYGGYFANPSDVGVYGEGHYGVRGYSDSLSGYGGYFANPSNVGVYGEGDYGVYGFTTYNAGYGGAFYNTDSSGVAVLAAGSGKIKSTADTQIVVNPFNFRGSSTATSTPKVLPITDDGGWTYLRTSASGSQAATLPVTLPVQVFGVPQKLKSIKVCYHLDDASSYIDKTEAYYANDYSVSTSLFVDDTNRTSLSWTCYTVNDPTPNPIQGSFFVRFGLYYAGTDWPHDIIIGNITLTLTEN
jgi:hypothetical protein